VVSVAVGAPVAALPVPTAPSTVVSAPENATTEMLPTYEPDPRVAVTATLLNAREATASQTSAVPGCALVRSRSLHINPPPVTELMLCPFLAFGPSEAINATTRSFAIVVVSDPDVILDDATD
jgi:hypothetical protein